MDRCSTIVWMFRLCPPDEQTTLSCAPRGGGHRGDDAEASARRRMGDAGKGFLIDGGELAGWRDCALGGCPEWVAGTGASP